MYPIPRDWRFGQGTLDAYDCGAPRHAIRTIVAAPHHNVLSVEKNMSTRMWEYAHKVTRKCFMERVLLRGYVEQLPNAPFRLDTLQNLELNFTNREFAVFFGMKAVPFRLHHHPDEWQQATILKEIPALKNLSIRFRAPLVDRSRDPWVQLGGLREAYGLQPWSWSETRNYCEWKEGHNCLTFEVSCQRTLLDWILTYAVDYIKDVPKVTLCGWIKDDVRERWEGILADERSGTHHTFFEAKQVIENWNIEDL